MIIKNGISDLNLDKTPGFWVEFIATNMTAKTIFSMERLGNQKPAVTKAGNAGGAQGKLGTEDPAGVGKADGSKGK